MKFRLQQIEKYKYFLLSLIVFCISFLLINADKPIPFNQIEFQNSFSQKEKLIEKYIESQKDENGIKTVPTVSNDFFTEELE